MIATPTLRVERSGESWVIIATSYNRDAPSGLGEFGTRRALMLRWTR